MRFPVPIGRQSSAGQATAESAERLLNGYVEAIPTGKEPTPVYGTPGLKLWASGLDGQVRGTLEMTGVAYAVCGGYLYSFDSSGNPTKLGAIPNSDLVQMDGDGTHVVVVTGGKIYVYTVGGSVVMVTDPDAPSAATVVFIDDFFLFGEAGTQQFFISALGDPTNYNALDFSSAEWKPDNLVTPVVQRRTVFMLGTKTLEAQQNTGAANFPFERYQDLFIDVGIVGPHAKVVTNDALFWVAHDFTVRRLDGITATPISTPRIDRLIKGWADQSQTVAFSHVLGSHLFVGFWNPDGCVVFDQATQLWHERASYGRTTWRARHVINCYGLTIFGSATEGKLYVVDDDTWTEDGETHEFETITPYVYSGNKRLTVNELEVVAETGGAAPGLDAQITCEKSRDGMTWGPRKSRSLGRQGETTKKVQFGPQGQGRQLTWRLRITDPVRRAMLGIYADVDVEP